MYVCTAQVLSTPHRVDGKIDGNIGGKKGHHNGSALPLESTKLILLLIITYMQGG